MLFCLLGYISILLTLFCLFYFFSYIICSCSLTSHVQYLFLPFETFETAALTKTRCRGGQEMDVHVNLFLIMQSRWCVDGDSSSSFCKVFHAVFQHKFFLPTPVKMYNSSGLSKQQHMWNYSLRSSVRRHSSPASSSFVQPAIQWEPCPRGWCCNTDGEKQAQLFFTSLLLLTLLFSAPHGIYYILLFCLLELLIFPIQ